MHSSMNDVNNLNNQLPRNSVPQRCPSSAILAFLDDIEAARLELHSLMLLQTGAVLAEGWWAPYARTAPHMLYSLSKSFTSTAAGMAIAEGRFSLEDAVISFFPDDVPDEVSGNLRAMRVRHLLTMATGHAQEPTLWKTPPGGSWARQFLTTPVEKEPGTHFLYNSPATYMVAALVEKTTGESLLNYLTPRLLAPLGIEGATWETDPHGIAVGGWGLNVTTEDIARFGQFYLQKGVWNGERLLAEEWVDQATSKQISNGDDPNNDWNQGYGFQFWRSRHGAYRGDGAFGQYCLVMPEQEAVLAFTSGVEKMGSILELVWERLLPGLKETEHASETPADYQRLKERLESLAVTAPQNQTASPPPLAGQVSGAVYRFAPNDQQIESVTLAFNGASCLLTFQDSDDSGDKETHRVEGGLSDWKQGTTTFLQSSIWPSRRPPTQVVKTRMRGGWINGNTLVFKLCYCETPFSPTLTFHFEDERTVTLNIRGSVGFGPSERPPLTGKKE